MKAKAVHQLPAALLWGALLVLFVSLAPQGVDLADDGFHVYYQRELLRGRLPHPLTYLSNLVGALWLGLADRLLWYRLGGAAIFSSCGMIAFVLVRRTFPRVSSMQASLLVFAFTILVHSRVGNSAIHYESVPVLLSLLFLLSLSRRWFASGAALIPLMVLARFPTIAGLFIPLGLAPWGWLRRRDFGPALLRGARSVVIGFALGGLGALIILLAMGHLEDYGRGVQHVLLSTQVEGGGHSFSAMVYQIVRRGGQMLLALVAMAPAYWILGKVARAGHGGLAGFLGPGLTYGLLLVLSNSKDAFFYSAGQHFIMYLSTVCTVVGVGLLVHPSTRERLPDKLVFVAALLFQLVIMAGSNTGIIKMSYMLWFVGPYVTLVLLERLEPSLSRGLWRGGLGALLLIGVYQELSSPNMTSMNRLEMVHPFGAERTFLRGIYEEKEKVEAIEAVADRMDARLDEDDLVLFYVDPLFYALTPAVAFSDHALFFQLAPSALVKEFERSQSRHGGRLPELVVTRTTGYPSDEVMKELLEARGYRAFETVSEYELWSR